MYTYLSYELLRLRRRFPLLCLLQVIEILDAREFQMWHMRLSKLSSLEREGGRANYGVVWGTAPTTRHLHTAVMWRTISVTGSMNPKLVIIVMSRPGVFLAFSTWAQYIRYYCADSEWLPYSRVMIFARYMQFLCNMQCIFWYFKYFRVLFVIFVWKCLYLLQMLARCTSSLINLRRWQDLFADLISNNCR